MRKVASAIVGVAVGTVLRAVLAASLASCTPASQRGSLVMAADLSNAVAAVLRARKRDIEERAVAEFRARAALCQSTDAACFTKAQQAAFNASVDAQHANDRLVMMQREVADLIEMAARCASEGDRECANDATGKAVESIRKLQDALR